MSVSNVLIPVACTGLRRGRGERVTRAQSGGGVGWVGLWGLAGVGDSPQLGVSRFTIFSRFFVMLIFLFCKLFEHYSQTNFAIIKTKPYKVTKYIKSMAEI